MKKAFCLTFLLIVLAVTLIADTPMATSSTGNFSGDQTAGSRLSGSKLSGSDAVPMDTMKSRVPIPAPSTLLLIGSGIIGLIIYRKKHKEQE